VITMGYTIMSDKVYYVNFNMKVIHVHTVRGRGGSLRFESKG